MNQIGRLNTAINRNLQVLLNLWLKDLNIASGQYDFLYVLAQNQGYSQQELSEHLYIGKSTTAKAVKELEDKGYVIRKKDPKDGRVYRLYLTEEGHQLMPRVNLIFEQVMVVLEENLSQQELIKTSESLEQVLKNLTKEIAILREKGENNETSE